MKVIISAATPSKIPYMKNPPAQGAEIQYLSPEEFEAKFKCKYTEGVVVKGNNKPEATLADFSDARAKAAYERIKNPLEGLVICEMSHGMGCGLFTTKDIPAGTVICIYAGEYNPSSSEFVYSCSSVDAAKMGGFARFMQHQPISAEGHLHYLMQGLKDKRLLAIQENISEEEAAKLLDNSDYLRKAENKHKSNVEHSKRTSEYNFQDIKFSDAASYNTTAQSNVFYEIAKVADVDVILMIAMRDIKANESIGFSYGRAYFRHPTINKPPMLFTKTGEVMQYGKDYQYKPNKLFDNAFDSLFGASSSHYYSKSSSSHESEEDSDFSDSSDNEYYANAYSNPAENIARAMRMLQATPKFDANDSTTHISSLGAQSISEFASTERKQALLLESTASFFKTSIDAQWKKYPENRLVGKYVGHQVRFFTMPTDSAEAAKQFTHTLKQVGFDAELKAASGKPSIVIDLTASNVLYLK